MADDLLEGDRRLVLGYASGDRRNGFEILLALDATLGNAVRLAGTPILGQLRLGWWRDQLSENSENTRDSDPVLHAARSLIRSHDVKQGDLIDLVNGWETVLNELPLSREMLTDYAALRGGGLFRAAAKVAGTSVSENVEGAGMLWALTDLACHMSDAETALRAEAIARMRGECARSLSGALRPFAILTRFAECDLAVLPEARPKSGSPKRMLQALGFVVFRR